MRLSLKDKQFLNRFPPVVLWVFVIFGSAMAIALLIYIGIRSEAFSGDGSGDQNDPYKITSCNQLQEVNQNLSASYVLDNDIDCTETPTWNGGAGFEPIGSVSSGFSGTFNGQQYSIIGLSINRNIDAVGLFGATTSTATISHLILEGGSVRGGNCSDCYTGALVGKNEATISQISIAGVSVISDGKFVGGLAGYSSGSIQRSSATDEATFIVVEGTLSDTSVGGLVGFLDAGHISNSFTDISVVSENTTPNTRFCGGLVGTVNVSTVEKSHASGQIQCSSNSASSVTTGFIGHTIGENTIQHNFSRTAVYPADTITYYGFIDQGDNLESNYYDFYTTQINNSNPACAAITSPSQCIAVNESGSQSNYFTTSSNPPINEWDFDAIWKEGPTLRIPPYVATGAASDVKSSSAGVHGEVEGLGGGGTIETGFEYGLDTDYGGLVYATGSHTSIEPVEYTGQIDMPFTSVTDAVVDSEGFIYVAGGTKIRKYDSEYNFITEFGSYGTDAWQLRSASLTIDQEDNLYVADTSNARVIKMDRQGNILAQIGSQGTSDGKFLDVGGVAVNSQGMIYVTDRLNHRVQVFNPDLSFAAKFGSFGTGNTNFSAPSGIAIDSADNIYIVDTLNNRVVKYDSSRNYVAHVGSAGSGNAQFNFSALVNIGIDQNNKLLVPDPGNNRIQRFDTNLNHELSFGSQGVGDDEFESPRGLAFTADGNLLIADRNNQRLKVLDSSYNYVTEINRGKGGLGLFHGNIAIDSSNNKYVASVDSTILKYDENNNPIGQLSPTSIEDSLLAVDLAIDGNDNVYVLYHRGSSTPETGKNVIIKYTSSGQETNVWTITNADLPVWNVDIESIALDSNNNMFLGIEDATIRKLDQNGDLVTEWGSFGTGNGQFGEPTNNESLRLDVAVDSLGRVYVADTYNNRIQRFSNSGAYQTRWGSLAALTDRDRLYKPSTIYVDQNDTVYVSDNGMQRVKMYSTSGTVTGLIGHWGYEISNFNEPFGIAVDQEGLVYVADYYNSRVQIFQVIDKIQDFTTIVTDLACGSTYHYRAFAESSTDGKGYGEDKTFTTEVCDEPELLVTTTDADNISQNSSTLNGYTTPPGVTEVGFEYGKTTSYGEVATADINKIPNYHKELPYFGPYSAISPNDSIYTLSPEDSTVTKLDNDGNILDQWSVLSSMTYIAVDSNENVYIVRNQTSASAQVYKYASDGTLIKSWNLYDSAGAGSIARPRGIAIDKEDNVYINDTYNYRVIKFNSNGTFLMQFGTAGPADGMFPTFATNPSFGGIAVDSKGSIIVAQYRRIQKFNRNGIFEAELCIGGCGANGNGSAISELLNMTVDSKDNVYVVAMNYRAPYGMVYKFDSEGRHTLGFGLEGSGPGQYASGTKSIAIDSHGRIYIGDGGNGRTQLLDTAITTDVSDLECGTTYHYRAYATNSNGTGYGDDLTFTTEDCPSNLQPPQVTTEGVDWITDDSAVMRGTTTPRGVYERGVEYGTDTNYGQSLTDSGTESFAYASQFGGNLGCPDEEDPEKIISDEDLCTSYGIDSDSEGNIYVSDYYNHRVKKYDANGEFIKNWGSFGSGNGQLDSPRGLVVDGNDNIYVADYINARIQKFDSDGNFITAWGSYGSGDGEFEGGPVDITVDKDGNILVIEDWRVQKFDSDGNFISKFGSYGCYGFDVFTPGTFCTVSSIATDSQGNIYTLDYTNHHVLKFSNDGILLDYWGGFEPGLGQFNYPFGRIVIDDNDRVFVADTLNHRIQQFDTNGNYVSMLGAEVQGVGDGEFTAPLGMGLDSHGRLLVSDFTTRIQVFTLEINVGAPSLECNTTYHYRAYATNEAGTGHGEDGTFATSACSSGPPSLVTTLPATDVTSDSSTLHGMTTPKDVTERGFEYGADTNYGQSITDGSTFSYVLKDEWGTTGTGNGQFSTPTDIARDSQGDLYIVDMLNYRIQKLSSAGTFIGAWGSQGVANGEFGGIADVAVGIDNSVFVADASNCRVQKFDSNGLYLMQWGLCGTGNGQFMGLTSVAVASDGSIYTSEESGYGGQNRIQKFDANGNYLSQWGSDGTGDGEFDHIIDIAIDSNDNIYATDIGNDRVQKFDANGNFITKWGTAGTEPGQFLQPTSLAIDSDDNIYVTDGSVRVQKFDANGNHITEWWGDNNTEQGEFSWPHGVVVADNGAVYVVNTSFDEVLTYHVNISVPLTNLSCETTYHYRAYAIANSETRYGDDLTFTTEACDENPDDPIEITDCEQLQAIAIDRHTLEFGDTTADYVLANDIDCSETVNWEWPDLYGAESTVRGFLPIMDYDNESPFTGTFDGQGFTISNLHQTDIPVYSGLFGAAYGAEISNLKLTNLDIIANQNGVTRMTVGGLAGLALNTLIENVSTTGQITIESFYGMGDGGVPGTTVGGLVGWSASEINKSFSEVDITATMADDEDSFHAIGGLIGFHYDGELFGEPLFRVSNTYATGDIAVTGSTVSESTGYIGGLIGFNGQATIISESYAKGAITLSNITNDSVGGLIGLNAMSLIRNSFSTSPITGNETDVTLDGGLLGTFFFPGTGIDSLQEFFTVYAQGTANNYYDKTTTGQSGCIGNIWTLDDFDAGGPFDWTSCQPVNQNNTDPLYFINNTCNPPLDKWNFTSIWKVQLATTPLFVTDPSANPRSCAQTPPVDPPEECTTNCDPDDPPPDDPPEGCTTNCDPDEPPSDPPSEDPTESSFNPPSPTRPSRPDRPLPLTDTVQGASIGPFYRFVRSIPEPIARSLPYSLLLLLVALAALYTYSAYLEGRRRKALQALIDRFKASQTARSAYLEITSHYINTPLAQMQGTVELLAGTKQLSQDIVTTIQAQLKSLKGNAANLLNLSQDLAPHQQALVKDVASIRPASVLTNPKVWLPVVVIFTLVGLVNFILIQADKYDPGFIDWAAQVGTAIVGVIALGVSFYFMRTIKAHRQTLARQVEYETSVANQQATFIEQAYVLLNEDVKGLEDHSKTIAAKPKSTGFTTGLDNLNRIITKLYSLAQLTKQVPGLAWNVPVASALKNATTQLQPLADEKGITVSVDLETGVAANVDEDSLTHLVAAPLKNAIMASPTGSQVKVSVAQRKHKAMLTVQDPGPGIPKDKLTTILQPFSRLSTERFDTEGLGLDLYFAKVITDQYGGTIAITSPENGGTLVRVEVPTGE